ncbi:hypothetical protein SeMB42_g04357 [Synchytrium endobioticum]|uniref:Uncharacterized protein n=1 Tax=Synchytrium endobioticum TaxID=286115 RepID=A0A507CX41_9FUNG|nr:hypothetical protein SeLEV6574_g05061 [Synchytrium endobioticum]TPX44350.1 hypothetical protein SeMB42_g04357 [Synchytrium endobioticum]
MLSKIVLVLIAASSAVIAAPELMASKIFRDLALRDLGKQQGNFDYANARTTEEEIPEVYDIEDAKSLDADKDYGVYEERSYEEDELEGYGQDIYAKEIVCFTTYKIIYVTEPVKCDCTTETHYERPANIDLNKVKFEREVRFD